MVFDGLVSGCPFRRLRVRCLGSDVNREFDLMDILGLTVTECLLRIGLGAFIGFCIGLTGVGGGVLGLQATTLVLRMSPIVAVGTTSLYIFLTNISACFHHAKRKNIAWGPVIGLLAGGIPGCVLVSNWVSRNGADAAFQGHLTTFIIYIVFLSVIMMIVNAVRGLRKKVEGEERALAFMLEGHWLVRGVLSLLLGLLCGGLIGATSVGGGILIVPMMIIVFGLPASRSVGSSIFIAMILALLTAFVYGKGSALDVKTAVIMAIGSQAGVFYGSKLSTKVKDAHLRFILIALISVAAVIMLIKR
jgi:uncharacterized membrane protein YfcA